MKIVFGMFMYKSVFKKSKNTKITDVLDITTKREKKEIAVNKMYFPKSIIKRLQLVLCCWMLQKQKRRKSG